MKSYQINPLKKSAVLGATLASLGLKNTIPVHHGSQGCTAFIKNIMTQHFREIIPMQTTAIYNIALVLGDYNELVKGLSNVIEKNRPEVIGLITTGIPQVRGDDLKYMVKQFYRKHPSIKTEIIPIGVSDFEGDAETGFSDAICAFIDGIDFYKSSDNKDLLILTNFSMTCGDIDEIRYIVESFGLNPIFFPDISESLGGSFNHYYKITPGGFEYKTRLKKPVLAIGIGKSTEKGLNILKDKGIKVKLFPSLIGLKQTDDFIDFLSEFSNKTPSKSIIKVRGQLIDTMLDSHFYFNNKKIALAVEPDLAKGFYGFLYEELGIEISILVTTYMRDDLKEIDVVKYGDLFELEQYMRNTDLLMTNSNGTLLSDKYCVPLVRTGFPVKDEIGYPLKVFSGYKGSLRLLTEIANIFLHQEEEKSYQYKNVKGVKYHENRVL
ncbi:MAG: nitrogenase molybdenum-iron protein NifN [Deferribacteres bacterium]|jgi:nitrogenase molybdenum-iron cofactor biosynthesis protein NifN|nr:nitrogenase molybdenum-iron protein NifN [Deferribacteres bacterium]